ncbi:hypothetical protein PQR64_23440 [Paraburkholderia phytofirmans]|uniref:hypothetical protein n=1 Tax=Paraburkholderia phytofirmans TaxID=261302 RepID=UPI0038B8E1E9
MTMRRFDKPREGDRKLIGGIEHVRRRKLILNRRGQPAGYDRWLGFDWFVWEPV